MTEKLPDIDKAFHTNIRSNILKGMKKKYPDLKFTLNEFDENFITGITKQVQVYAKSHDLTDDQQKFMITKTLQSAIDELISYNVTQAFGADMEVADGDTD